MKGSTNTAERMNVSGQVIDFASRRRSRLSPCVKGALDYLDQNFSKAVSVDALSEILFISKYHLMREFKRETGSTIHEYLTAQRMTAAAGMIRAGAAIQETGEAVGYSDYSLFYKNFCKYAGVSPKEYQRQHSSDALPPSCIQIQSRRELLQA